MGAAIGIAVYALVFVGLLVIIRKTSPLNVLTKSWASFILYFVMKPSPCSWCCSADCSPLCERT